MPSELEPYLIWLIKEIAKEEIIKAVAITAVMMAMYFL